MKKYIFLDFDGVLNINGKEKFYRAQHFADSIKNLDDLWVVFSTSWREYTPLERLTDMMPRCIHHKCIGKTPFINYSMSQPRYQEIMQYNKEFNINDNQWVAIDDMQSLFPKDCPNLILTDAKIGFSKREAKLIKGFYENNIF